MLGFSLVRRFPTLMTPLANSHNRAADGEAWARALLDQPAQWLPWLQAEPPDLVIYAHAVCNVSKCQQHAAWARRMNIDCLASVLQHVPAATRFVYLSSDHVFGGDGIYDESSSPRPISVYGETRVAAERLVLQRPGALVVRSGLAIGPSLNGRAGFFDWLRYRQAQQLPLTVIRDEWRSTAWSADLAQRVFDLARSELTGIRHVTTQSVVSRPVLARVLMQQQGVSPDFDVRARAEQSYPHLGYVELATIYDDELAAPLPALW